MSKNEKLILICNALFTLANAMGAVFMNVFLYTYTESLPVMAMYTCIRIAMFPLFFIIAGKIARKLNYGITLSIGLLFFALQLFMVLNFHDSFTNALHMVYLAAVLYGVGESFYYLSVNTLNQLVSSPSSRSAFLSVNGVLTNIANVVAPLVASYIIDCSLNDIIGYTTIFKVVLVIFVISALLGLLVNEKGNRSQFYVIKNLSFQGDPQWKYVLMTYFLYGFRDSLILALAGILVYNATSGSGSLYGKLLAVFAVLSILAYMFVSKYMVRKNRMVFYNVGAYLLASSTIVLVLVPNIFGAIYYGVVNAIGTALYSTPFSMIMMNACHDYEENENITGRVIAREIYISVSRCVSMLFIVLCYNVLPGNTYLFVSVGVLSLMPIVHMFYANRYHRIRDGNKNIF